MKVFRTTLAALSVAASSLAICAPLTLTGADLLANPLVQFPIGAPSLNGTSVHYGGSAMSFGELVSIPLAQFGIGFDGSPTTISFSVNLRRMTVDWDAFIVLGDGTSLLGAAAGDNSNGQAAAEVMDDLGDSGSSPVATILYTDAGFPAVDEFLDVALSFLLETTQTTMEVSFGTGSATHVFAQSFSAGAPLSLVLLRDNDISEQYQLRSITLDVPMAAPEPVSLALVGVALFGIAATRRRCPPRSAANKLAEHADEFPHLALPPQRLPRVAPVRRLAPGPAAVHPTPTILHRGRLARLAGGSRMCPAA